MVKYGFETVDTDRNGVIDFKEFETWYQMRCGNHDTIKVSIVEISIGFHK